MVTKWQFSVIIVPSPFIIWHSSTRKCVLFFPFIYPCVLGQTHGSLSYSMGYNPSQLLTELEAWATAARGPSHCLLCPFQPHTVLCIYTLSGARNRIRLISNLLTSNPVKSATFLRIPGFFSVENSLQTKMWVSDGFIVVGCHCFQALSVDRTRTM